MSSLVARRNQPAVLFGDLLAGYSRLKIELNFKTAKAPGLSIPSGVFAIAEEVIE